MEEFNMEKPIYVHYGHKKFCKEMCEPIKNIQLFTKPRGGVLGI